MNIKGRLILLDHPRVMGILNLTPDSFYSDSRMGTSIDHAVKTTGDMLASGADIIDIGACSTRPGGKPCSEEEETKRLKQPLLTLRKHFPQAIISVDTFRSGIARMAVEECGADIINDVSGAEADPLMIETVAKLKVPYVITDPGDHSGDFLSGVFKFLGRKLRELELAGIADVIIDPGFGFGKSSQQNFGLLDSLDVLAATFNLPLLVGVSRKSMIYNTLGCSPREALNGTTALNTVALMKGASILRVHDVKEAVETIRLVGALGNATSIEN